MNENDYGIEKKIQALEKRTKLIVVLLVCVLAVSAAGLALQFVSPLAVRGGGGMGGEDFRNGQTPPDFSQEQDAPQTDG